MADVITTSFFVETPAAIVRPAKPLSQEGRILAALGLLRGPLPRAETKWLFRYYEYLAAHLCLPFDARCPEDSGLIRPWTSIATVVAILPPSESPSQDGTGLKCKALRNGAETEIPLIDLEIDSSHPNAQFVEDYWYWFWNWQFDPRI